MEFRSVLTSVIFVVLCLNFQEVKSHNCGKYCNGKSCSQYQGLPGDEFSDCVNAKIHCHCSTSTGSGFHPSDIIVYVGGGIIIAIIICCVVDCIRSGLCCCRNGNSGVRGGVYQPGPAYYPNTGGAYYQPAVFPSYYNNAGSAWQPSPYNPAYGNTYGTPIQTQPNAPLQDQAQKIN